MPFFPSEEHLTLCSSVTPVIVRHGGHGLGLFQTFSEFLKRFRLTLITPIIMVVTQRHQIITSCVVVAVL